jgi:uncharacterized membrane-anchored protein
MTQPQELKGSSFTEHGLRERVLAEVHARPFVPISSPRRILHFAFMIDPEAAETARAALAGFCQERGGKGPAPGAKHHRVELSPAVLRWEHHGEFMTYAWEFPQEPPKARTIEARQHAFRPSAAELAYVMRLLPQPGPLLVAVDLQVAREAPVRASWQELFGASQLVASEVLSGAAVIATDFLPDSAGFVRMLILDRKLTPCEAGALVQRLLEVETYRTLALLGLPKASDLGPEIRRIETELPRLVHLMRESEGFDASRQLLDRLTALAADLEAGASQSLYRFGATRAYYELMNLRLDALGEQALPNLPTFAAFLARRLTPAIRTCASVEARQDNLSRKLSRAAQLLRTRVDVDLESQNRDLLRTMGERVDLQVRMQQAVKWISFAASTYYIAAILHLLFEGIHQKVAAFDPLLATAIAIPLAMVFVAWVLRRGGKRLGGQ